MRASRAYIASLGTTTVLVGSALLLLAVVSTLVAFRGWPGVSVGEDVGSLVVDGSDNAVRLSGPAQVAVDAASASGAVADRAAPVGLAPGSTPGDDASLASTGTGDFAPGSGGTGGGSGGVVVPEGLGSGDAGTGEVPISTDPDSVVPPLLPEGPLSPTVQNLTGVLGDTTQNLTGTLGETADGLNPRLGQTLTDTGKGLADIIRGLGQPRQP